MSLSSNETHNHSHPEVSVTNVIMFKNQLTMEREENIPKRDKHVLNQKAPVHAHTMGTLLQTISDKFMEPSDREASGKPGKCLHAI